MRHTFTFRQLEADPTLCAHMKRLWQDSEGKMVTFEVIEPKPRDSKSPIVAFASRSAPDAKVVLAFDSAPKPKAKGKGSKK